MEYERAVRFTRYNSGKHFLDSGDLYGRHHESEKDPQGEPLLYPTGDSKKASLYDVNISVNQLLVDCFEENEIITRYYEEFSKDSDLSYFEQGNNVMENFGYIQVARDNTYNNENDYSQNFIWEVWHSPEVSDGRDWVWQSEKDTFGYACPLNEEDMPHVIVVLYIHTGCDIRGGYSPPIFGTFCGETVIPFYSCVEFYIESFDEYGEEDASDFNDKGQGLCGYSSNPASHLEYSLGIKVLKWDLERKCFDVQWGDNKFRVFPSRPYLGE